MQRKTGGVREGGRRSGRPEVLLLICWKIKFVMMPGSFSWSQLVMKAEEKTQRETEREGETRGRVQGRASIVVRVSAVR